MQCCTHTIPFFNYTGPLKQSTVMILEKIAGVVYDT